VTINFRYITQQALDRALLEDRSYLGLNSNPYAFPTFRVGAFKTDGTVTLADSTNPLLQKLVGVTQSSILSGQRGFFVQRGTIEGAAAGLGAAAGDPIYLGIPAGTLTATEPSGVGVEVILVGYAEANTSGLVTNLRLALNNTVVSSGGGGGSGTVLEGSYRNGSGATLDQFRVASWMNTGELQLASPSLLSTSDVAGIVKSSIPANQFGTVQYGGVVSDALLGLGAQSGQPVFLSTGGQLSLNTPSNPAHSVVRIGYAVPKTNTFGSADDLLLDVELLFES
jgi:hypothetical protein